MSAPRIPDSVTGKELGEAMRPLLDLLGVPLGLLAGLRIDFVSGVEVTAIIPAQAGVSAKRPDLAPSNGGAEYAVSAVVRVTSPGPDISVPYLDAEEA